MQQPDAPPATFPFARSDALNIQLLGACRIILDDRVCDVSSWKLRKAAQLVEQLALAPGRQLHRDQVFESLWPELDPDATSNLRVTLHFARKLLTQDGFDGGDAIQSRGQQLALFPNRAVWTDIQAFEQAAGAARIEADPALYHAALELYTGDLLPEERFEDWASERRESLHAVRIELLGELAALQQRRGDVDEAIRTLRDVIDADPASEQAHAALMRAYAGAGRRVQALRQYQRLREALHHALDTEPDPQITHFYESLLARGGREATLLIRDDDVAPVTRPESRGDEHTTHTRTNLPVQLTSFIGRQALLPEVCRAVEQSRLLTLTGPAGTGKTRLAIEAVTRLAHAYPDGVCFVDLSSLDDSSLVAPAVAAALSTHEVPGQTLLDTLAMTLAARHAVLVLDNCEHVIDACAEVASTLLHACHAVRIVATSREPLRIDGEAVWPVPPLQAPAPEQSTPGNALESVESVQLFVERARAVTPGFMLSDEVYSAVAEICRRLEGIPLAIELAATRVRGVTVGELAQRLDDALGLLSGGHRDRPSRQQSLRAAIEWSYDLLPPDEQRLFERLSVFAGSISLEAIEAVCGPIDGAGDTLDLLFALLDKSLLVAEEHAGHTRYRMLETIRQYAAERLARAGETALIRVRHVDWYLMLARQSEPALRGRAQQEWMQRLEPEHDNARAALAWSLEVGDTERALLLSWAMTRFWEVRGRFSEGRRWLEHALALEQVPGSDRARLKAIFAAGRMQLHQTDYNAARASFDTALTLARRMSDDDHTAGALTQLGHIALRQGHLDAAYALYEQSLPIRRDLGDPWYICATLNGLGRVALAQGDYQRARMTLEESLTLLLPLGDRSELAYVLLLLGQAASQQGDHPTARAMLEESLAHVHEIGHPKRLAMALASLGEIFTEQGNASFARARFAESLSLYRELDVRQGVVSCLEGLARLATGQVQPERALRLAGAAASMRETLGLPLSPAERIAVDRTVATARAALGDQAFAVALAEGRAMSLDQAVEHALAEMT